MNHGDELARLAHQAYVATRVAILTDQESVWDTIIRQVEWGMLTAALELFDGNQTEAAIRLQKNRVTLRTHMKKHQHLLKLSGRHWKSRPN